MLQMEQRTKLGILLLLGVCHRGGPVFLTPWLYKYIACRLQEVLKDLSQALPTGSLYCDIYKNVSHAIIIIF